MTTTTELPIADAMTAAELMAHRKELHRLLGPKANVLFYISDFCDQQSAAISLRPDGFSAGGKDECLHGTSWADVLPRAYEWVGKSAIVRRDTTIRKMALAIIELTDEHAKCTDTMLRLRDFSAEQIAEFHEMACARAGEMCGNAPFRVEFGA